VSDRNNWAIGKCQEFRLAINLAMCDSAQVRAGEHLRPGDCVLLLSLGRGRWRAQRLATDKRGKYGLGDISWKKLRW
jgi:hypothetical protein